MNATELEILVNPLSKQRVYQVSRKIVFRKMDENKIAPERADKILDFVEKYVKKANSPKERRDFYLLLAKKFPELREIKSVLQSEFREKLDNFLSQLAEMQMCEGNLENAEQIMRIGNSRSVKVTEIERLMKENPGIIKLK